MVWARGLNKFSSSMMVIVEPMTELGLEVTTSDDVLSRLLKFEGLNTEAAKSSKVDLS